MRGRAIGGAVAALLLLVACSTPEPNRGAQDDVDRPVPTNATPPDGGSGARRDATLTGRVVGPDGSPLAGAPVTVVEGRSGFGLDAALTAIFTLGIACVASPTACDLGGRVADAGTTDAEGRYELTLPGAHLPGFETDEDWVLQVGRAPVAGELTGPSSSFELEVNTAVHEAPDLAVWDGTPTVTTVGDLLRIALPALGGDAGLDEVGPRFVDDGGDVVWHVEGETVDPRVLEDRSTRFVASGGKDVTVRHADGRTIYHQQVATATVPYAGALVPLSRAKPCASSAGGLVGCPHTDGDLVTRTPLATDEAVTVDLGAPAEVGLVVVRGGGSQGSDEVVVEASADGTAWQRLPHRRLSGAEGWSAGPRPREGVLSARYVRVGGGVAELAEISVWAPTAAERAAAAPSSSDGEGGGGGPGGDDDAVPWGAALTGGALVLGAGGLLIAARRRGRI